MATPAANNRTVGLLVGLLLLVLSLFVDWALVGGNPALSGAMVFPFVVKGTNGSLGMGAFSLPVWLIVSFGLLSLVLMLLNQRGVTALPRTTYLVPWLISIGYIVFGIGMGLTHRGMQLRVGFPLALVGLCVGLSSRRASRAET